jgi:hypothetical protein
MSQPTNKEVLRRHWLDLLLLAIFFGLIFFGGLYQVKH